MVSIDFTIFVQWLNFGVLLLILYLILYKPLIKFLDERNAKLKDDIESAKEEREKAERVHREHQAKLAELKLEAIKYLEEAKKKGEKERDRVLEETHKEAEKILESSLKEVKYEAEKIRQELKKEVAGLVTECASKVLEREVKEKDHHKFIDSFLEEEVKDGSDVYD